MPNSSKKIQTFRDDRYAVTLEVPRPTEIDAGRGRFLHGPAVVRCENGDWLAAYQDAHDDPGRNSFIRQARSEDGGATWKDEGAIYDEEKKGIGARNPAFGLSPDGTIVLVVQRVSLKRLGKIRGENIVGSALAVSEDNGKKYKRLGRVDAKNYRGHQGCSTHIVERGGVLYMAAFHPMGLVMYTSQDGGRSWPERIRVVPQETVPESPRYPTMAFLPDDSLLFLGHLNRSVTCFHKISRDRGQTWSDVRFYNDVALRHPVLLGVDGVVDGKERQILLCLGRDMDHWKTALCVSPDDGATWSDPIDIAPQRGSGGGYTALWPGGEPGKVFTAFSADGTGPGAQDILGMFLEGFTVETL